MNTSGNALPPELLRNGRPEDQTFEPSEALYRRVTAVAWPAGEPATGIALPFPDMSVNRQKYCPNPAWTLLPNWHDHGVLSFQVRDVPDRLEQPGVPHVFQFVVAHDPEEENYAHTEVRTYRDGIHDKRIEPPKSLRKRFRQILAERAKLLVPARSTAG